MIAVMLQELERERRPSDLVKKPIMENFKVPWNTQKWLRIAIFKSDMLHYTLHHPTKIQSDSCDP